jgi:peroxiredoxin
MIPLETDAPDFKLKDQNGTEVHLADLRDKKVLLSFHPLAWTRVCADQMKSLEANHERFKELNAIALGISIDSVPSKNAWAKELGIQETQLLADFWPHGEIASLYEIFRHKDGFSERANIILDEKQRVVFARTYPLSHLPDIDELIEFMDKKM